MRTPSFSRTWPRIEKPPDSSPPISASWSCIAAATHLNPTGVSITDSPCVSATRSIRNVVETVRTAGPDWSARSAS